MGGMNEDAVSDHEVYCISASCTGHRADHGGRSIGIKRGISYTLTTRDRHAVVVPATEDPDGEHLARRLTPLECERLQGFPDRWTESGHEGQRFSDDRRCRMLGNSIAIPCAAYIMQGICDALGHERKEEKLHSVSEIKKAA